jgi:hypothetical protein
VRVDWHLQAAIANPNGHQPMKQPVRLPIIVLAAILAAQPLQAVEFMYKDNQGYDLFSCGTHRRGGLVRVKALGGSRYQVFSKPLSGEFEISAGTVEAEWCLGATGAARIACGLCKFSTPKDSNGTGPNR